MLYGFNVLTQPSERSGSPPEPIGRGTKELTMNKTFDAVMGKEDTVAALEDLKIRYERGEFTCVALRVFLADGTWEDMALGGTEEEQEAALADLYKMHEQAQ